MKKYLKSNCGPVTNNILVGFLEKISVRFELLLTLLLLPISLFAQQKQQAPLNTMQKLSINTAKVKGISEDSLKGFDEGKLKAYLSSENVRGTEHENYVTKTKRDYINVKYNFSQRSMRSAVNIDQPGIGSSGNRISATPCNNEGFESTTIGQYTGPSITGWSIASSNGYSNTCSTNSIWWNPGSPKFWVRATPIVNPIPTIPAIFAGNLPNSPLGGSKVAQLNDFNFPPGYRTKIRQTINVTSSNTLFQFAFAGAYVDGLHSCCTQPGLKFTLYDCSGNAVNCASLSVSPYSGCSSGAGAPNKCIGCFSGQDVLWFNWQSYSMNLTPYIGQCVTVEFINSDCAFGGHPSVTFLDCLCGGPLLATNVINVAGPITVVPTTTTICKGSSVLLSASGSPSYAWYGPGGYLGSTAAISVSPLVNSVYTVNATAGSCVIPKTVTVNVVPGVTLSIVDAGSSLCTGDCTILTASSNVTGTTFTWTSPFISTTNPITVCPSVTTTYSLVGRAPNGCKNFQTKIITVKPRPAVTASGSPSVICAGSPATITASGASTYVWAPISSSSSTVQVFPTTSTIYTATGTGTNGCSSTATVAIKVLTTPTAVVQPACICSGITNTLIGLGGMTYTWYIGGTSPATIIAATLTLNLSSSTPFTLCASGANGCRACTTSTIPTCGPIPLTISNITLCSNAASCTNISVSSSASPVNYSWSGTGINGSSTGATINICTSVTCVYSVNATSTSTAGCPNSATLAVSIASNCCSQPTTGLTLLSTITGPLLTGSYLLNSSQTLLGSTSFQNAEIWITENVSLTVPPGKVLNLDKAHLFACGIKMWNGIIVQDGGQITTNITAGAPPPNSMIEDAKIAIELDNISFTNTWPLYPIDIQDVIFNKNYIGIKISNSDPTLDSLALRINGCVFSSRTMPFTTYPFTITWPYNIISGPSDLRAPTTAIAGLAPPYTLNNYPQTNLKIPYTNIPGQTGIKIENIGNPNDFSPKPGVMIGLNYSMIPKTNFNLFDGLGNGIDVKDASLTTQNGVFQNMRNYPCPLCPNLRYGGNGINHEITGLMNARLSSKGTLNTRDGNLFWDCINGIRARNVYDFYVRFNIFRSTHDCSLAFTLFPVRGENGIDFESNRFQFAVEESQFNNLKYGVNFRTPVGTQPYDMTGTGTVSGVYAAFVSLQRNYFGPLVTSTVAYSAGLANMPGSEYLGDAICLITPNTSGWTVGPDPTSSSGSPYLSIINSNRIDRAFRGITINSFEDSPLSVGGNSIYIENDLTFGNPKGGYGIAAMNNTGNLAILNNTVQSLPWYSPPFNANLSAIYSNWNTGAQSPDIECNFVNGSWFGFLFDDQNPNTVWQANHMCNNWAGLALINNGVIGQQGNPSMGCGDIWDPNCGPWGSGNGGPSNFETYVENSDPTSSPLFVKNPPFNTGYAPTQNSTNFAYPPYSTPTTILDIAPASFGNDCWISYSYSAVPGWKIAGSIKPVKDGELNESFIQLFPNPTNGQLTIVTGISEHLTLRVMDMAGREVLVTTTTGDKTEIDLSEIAPSIYIIELQQEKKVFRRKLIKITNEN